MLVKIDIRKSEKCNGDYSLFITFPYNTDLINYFRQFNLRWYHTDTKEWELASKYLDEVMLYLKSMRITCEIFNKELLNQKKEVISIPTNYKFKTKPFEHQLEALNFGLNKDKWLLGDTMGLGKTKVAIDLACIKKQTNGYKHCLIVCGVNGLKWNWLNEINTHSYEKGYILGQANKNGKLVIGTTEDKYNDIANLAKNEAYFIITNIETMRNEKCATALRKQCSKGEISMIVLDEAHVCKNTTSQQGKGMLKTVAETMLAMTGTPLMNNPLDLYFILKWLGYEKHNLYAFKNYYCEMGGYGGYEIVGYKHLNELQEQLNDFMLRRLKEDVFDLPEKIYVDEYVELLPKQKLVYNEVRQMIKMNIDQIKMINNPLTELIRMRQATGYPGILSSTVTESAKLDRLEELVDEAVKNNQKVVIFSNWTQMTDAIKNRLRTKQLGLRVITGETSDSVRQNYVDDFQSNENCKVILGTIGAMGTGITLTAGTVEIFVDEPWNKALKEQAVDRCHRIGTKSNVTIYTLIAKNTIDERIHELVEHKGAIADMIVDGKIVGNKKEILEFLLN